MAAGDYFTPSQEQAWSYVESGVNRGMTMTGALAEYRAGGGSIRTQYWSDLWNTLKGAKSDWDTVNYYKPTDTLPAYLYVSTPINYANTYTVRAKATIIDSAGNVIADQYRQVSFSTRKTKGEIMDALANEFNFGVTSAYGAIKEVTEFEFYRTRK